MPITTVQTFLRDLLLNLVLPGDIGTLETFITPPNPDADGTQVACYIWGSDGAEKRLTFPRAAWSDLSTGGTKQIIHQVDVWLLWFLNPEDPEADTLFPSVIDAVMAVLRNAPQADAAEYAINPATGQRSQLLAIGEDMTWQYAAVKATANERYIRYDAQITCEVVEEIQA